MKLRTLILAALLLLALAAPTMAQTDAPTLEATAPAPTTEPTAVIVGAPGEPVPVEIVDGETPSVPVAVVIDLIERQPELLTDMTDIVADQIGGAFERSTLTGIVALVVVCVVSGGGFILLYRSTPPDRRNTLGQRIAGAGSTFLGRLDELDVLKDTDIENIIIRALKRALDERLAPTVETAVASALQTRIDNEREGARAQRLNASLSGNETPFGVVPPDRPAAG